MSGLNNLLTDVQLGYTCFRNDEWCPITWPERICVPEISGCIYLMHDPAQTRFYVRVDTSFGNWVFDVAAAGGCTDVWDFGIGRLQFCIKDVTFEGGNLTGLTIEFKACLPYGIGCASLYSYRFTIGYLTDASQKSSAESGLSAQGKKNAQIFGGWVIGEIVHQLPNSKCGC